MSGDKRDVRDRLPAATRPDAPTITRMGDSFSPSGEGEVPSLPVGGAFGHFRIVRLLGSGGMGQVFEAEDTQSGRRVALKVLSGPTLPPEDRSRFLREGRLAAAISDPHCVYVFGTEEIDGRPVIAMELVPRGTLRDLVRERGPLPYGEAVDAILQVVSGLEAAGRAGILHRDVKPSNCFIDANRGIKIGDFGLSVSAQARAEEVQLTVTGSFMGTPAFASPEQLQGGPLDVRSDIYSVGATLYWLLAGRAPFDQEHPVSLVAAILQQEAASPSVLRDDVPRDLGRAVLRCLAKRPSVRFQAYADLRSALAPFGSAARVPAQPRLRLFAGIADWGLWFASWMTIYNLRPDLAGRLDVQLLGVAAYTAYFALPEGLWGSSPGKLLARIRVVGPVGNSPGPGRAAVRAAIFAIVPAVPATMVLLAAGDPATYLATMSTVRGQLVSGSSLLLLLALFATARRSNGYAGIHELASGTRVVRRIVGEPRLAVDSRRAPSLQSPAVPATIGPYEIVGPLGNAAVLSAADRALGRAVWIVKTGPEAPSLAPERRDLDRPGRLRWLNGGRTESEGWNAYEAPEGAPLAELLGQPRPWREVRHWLLDLAEELDAGMRDGTLPAHLGLEHVWISQDGRARLLDFSTMHGAGPEPGANEGKDASSAQAFLHRIALSALLGRVESRDDVRGRMPEMPLPLHARSFLQRLSIQEFEHPGAAAEQLRLQTTEAAVVTRGRRAAQLMCSLSPLAFVLSFLLAGGYASLDPRHLTEAGDVAELEVCLGSLAGGTDEEGMEPPGPGRPGSVGRGPVRVPLPTAGLARPAGWDGQGPRCVHVGTRSERDPGVAARHAGRGGTQASLRDPRAARHASGRCRAASGAGSRHRVPLSPAARAREAVEKGRPDRDFCRTHHRVVVPGLCLERLARDRRHTVPRRTAPAPVRHGRRHSLGGVGDPSPCSRPRARSLDTPRVVHARHVRRARGRETF